MDFRGGEVFMNLIFGFLAFKNLSITHQNSMLSHFDLFVEHLSLNFIFLYSIKFKILCSYKTIKIIPGMT